MGEGDDLREPPQLDEGPYTNLASAFRLMAECLWTRSEQRIQQKLTAEDGWAGDSLVAFRDRFEQGLLDTGQVYLALHHAASLVDGRREGRFPDLIPDPGQLHLLGGVRRENERRRQAGEWLRRRDHYRNTDSVGSSIKDFFGAEPDWESVEDIGPFPEPVPEPFLAAARPADSSCPPTVPSG